MATDPGTVPGPFSAIHDALRDPGKYAERQRILAAGYVEPQPQHEARAVLAAVGPFLAKPTPGQMLREFHRSKAIHGGLMPDEPSTDVPADVRDLRIALLAEEVEELRQAMLAGDMVQIADGIADVVFVAVGTAVPYGIDFDAVFREVHRSNMTKTNETPKAKLTKGPGYEPPDIAAALGQRGRQAVQR